MLKAELKGAPTLGAKLNSIGESNQTLAANISGTRFIGRDGKNGKSAYEIALDNGFEGTETEWLESLHGKDGYTPVKGEDYWTESDKQEMVADVISALPLYDGPTEVTPMVNSWVLPTAQKIMKEDLTVKAIPYYDVSNSAGGSTIFIGNEV